MGQSDFSFTNANYSTPKPTDTGFEIQPAKKEKKAHTIKKMNLAIQSITHEKNFEIRAKKTQELQTYTKALTAYISGKSNAIQRLFSNQFGSLADLKKVEEKLESLEKSRASLLEKQGLAITKILSQKEPNLEKLGKELAKLPRSELTNKPFKEALDIFFQSFSGIASTLDKTKKTSLFKKCAAYAVELDPSLMKLNNALMSQGIFSEEVAKCTIDTCRDLIKKAGSPLPPHLKNVEVVVALKEVNQDISAYELLMTAFRTIALTQNVAENNTIIHEARNFLQLTATALITIPQIIIENITKSFAEATEKATPPLTEQMEHLKNIVTQYQAISEIGEKTGKITPQEALQTAFITGYEIPKIQDIQQTILGSKEGLSILSKEKTKLTHDLYIDAQKGVRKVYVLTNHVLGEGSFKKATKAVEFVFNKTILQAKRPVAHLTSKWSPNSETVNEEIHANRALAGPNVLTMHNAMLLQKNNSYQLCAFSELCEGDLFHLRQDNRLPKDSLSRIKVIKELLEGLVSIHEKGWSHGDIKPENCFMVEGVAKVGDLGKSLPSELFHEKPNNTMAPYRIYGTPGYSLPTLPTIQNPSAKDAQRNDLYALGATFLELQKGTTEAFQITMEKDAERYNLVVEQERDKAKLQLMGIEESRLKVVTENNNKKLQKLQKSSSTEVEGAVVAENEYYRNQVINDPPTVNERIILLILKLRSPEMSSNDPLVTGRALLQEAAEIYDKAVAEATKKVK
ncbi:MAG: kinase domain protein [Chlamydiia bacterium]|nr:kinase domain protein [Chlamydiia bacterium]